MWSIISAGIGLIVGGLGYIGQWGATAEESKEEIRRQEARRKRNLELMDLEYETNKKEANKEADKSDEATTLAEAVMGKNASNALQQMGLGQEADALQYNEAAINAGTSEGSAYNSISGAGTRGSSSLQSVEMQSELQAQNLQTQEDIDRKNSDLTLASAMTSMNQGAFDLQNKRSAAKDLRDTFNEGGDQYNLYQKHRSNYIADVQENIDKLNENTKWGWDDTLGVLTGGISGASSGYEIGSQADDFAKNWNQYKLERNAKQARDMSKLHNQNTTDITFNNIGHRGHWNGYSPYGAF